MVTPTESSLIISINNTELNTEKVVLIELRETTRRERAKKKKQLKLKRIARGKKF